jgi:hypothetical protein
MPLKAMISSKTHRALQLSVRRPLVPLFPLRSLPHLSHPAHSQLVRSWIPPPNNLPFFFTLRHSPFPAMRARLGDAIIMTHEQQKLALRDQ